MTRAGLTRTVWATVLVVLGIQAAVAGPARADETRDRQWHLKALDIASVHQITQGEGVIVGLIDTGVDIRHPDLAGAVLPGNSDRGDDGRTDGDGHGTAMAGIIAARGRPGGAGALGIAPKANVLISGRQDRTYKPFAPQIDFLITRGVRVTSIAFGDDIRDWRTEEAIARAVAADVVVVAAAGNRPDQTAVGYPARFPGVIAAAGTDREGNHAKISVTGPEVVLAAPSDEVLSTYVEGRYRDADGTSNSTAIIAGAAALVRSKFPALKAPEVIRRLTATAVDKGAPGRDDEYGFGLLDIKAALTADLPPPSVAPSAGPGPVSEDRSLSPVVVGLLVAAGIATVGSGVVVAVAVVVLRRRRREGLDVPAPVPEPRSSGSAADAGRSWSERSF